MVRGRVELPTFRFSGECPGPHESIVVRLIRPDDLAGYLGVQDRPHVSTTVVSTALAAGLCTLRPLTFRFRGGESGSRDHSPQRVSRVQLDGVGPFVPKPSSWPASLPHRTVDLVHAVRQRPSACSLGRWDCHSISHSAGTTRGKLDADWFCGEPRQSARTLPSARSCDPHGPRTNR